MRLPLIVALSITAVAAFGQHGLVDKGTYESSVPAPSEVLGYHPGERFTDARLVAEYSALLASTSDRVHLQEYGRSVEGHPLFVLIISAPARLRELDALAGANRSLTDPRMTNPARAASLIDSLPAIIWLSFGVHGNEASSSETALAVAYELAAGLDPDVTAILDRAVVILDPLTNPDGRQRYVQWYRTMSGSRPRPDPDAAEHHEPWPGSRTNHYYFDLNRDWAWSTQPETQARVALYRQWMPHVHVDFHEMEYTSTYFFFPSAAPMHSQLPEQVRKWGAIFGRGNAETFDRLGIRYFVGESFDLFYPGYGDSWPTFMGAIGMTYEQAGHARAGLAVRRPDGSILTLRDRVRNHYWACMTTLKTAVSHRRERLKDFHDFWKTALAPAGPPRFALLPPGRDPGTLVELIRTLQRQGIEIGVTTQSVQIRATLLPEERAREMSFSAGTYVVDLRQPQSRLARALLEPRASVSDTSFYDISAWSLPLAFNIDAYWTEREVPSRVPVPDPAPWPEGRIVGGRAGVGYIIPWDRARAAVVVWELLERGFRVHVASKPFRLSGRDFGRGTCLAFVADQPDSLHAVLERSAHTHGVEIVATSTGWAESGISLGSNHIRPIRKPVIGILTGEPTSASDYGELWHLFDERYGIPFVPMAVRTLGSANLGNLNVLIMPDGSGFGRVLDSAQTDRLRRWVAEGGLLIAIEGAARYLLEKGSGFAELRGKAPSQRDTAGPASRAAAWATAQEREDRRSMSRIPGTILSIAVDTTHPVGFGLSPTMYVFKGDGSHVTAADGAHRVAKFGRDTVSVSGYLPPGRGTQIAHSDYAVELALGKGRVLLFSENLAFRGFWRGPDRLLLNALLIEGAR